MPREKDLIATIEAQARHVIKLIEDEMADLQGRLAQLQDQHARWTAVLDGSPPPQRARRVGPPSRATGAPKARKQRAPQAARRAPIEIDWEDVLKGLPDRFSMADIESATPALTDNPRARIAAVARWSKVKQVRKVGKGVYEKVPERPRKRITVATRPSGATLGAVEGDEGGEGEVEVGGGPEANGESPAA
jgi:hypothetical protein